MKKLVLLFAFTIGMCVAVNAQLGNVTKKATQAAGSAGFDINSIAKGIMGKLVPGLNLMGDQAPKLNEEVMNFLKKKAGIMSLKASNAAEYTKQQTDLFNNLKNRLGFILKPDQFKKFLALRPAASDKSNPLTHLFN
ncbi:MAG: hypothetical protein K2X37_11835 [Chitinophagaceae bacterium]|nr:hypothetical protein [Chitinophagaceae bacterium]